MRAATFNRPKDVTVGNRPDPVIKERTDAIKSLVRVGPL
jgi:hypothetical protein